MNPRVIPSTQVKIIFANAFTIIAMMSAMAHRTIPAIMIGIALRMMASILDSSYGNVAIV